MKKTILFLLLLVINAGVNAQFSVGYSVGYGTYDMGNMKDNLAYIRDNINSGGFGHNAVYAMAIVDNFPSHITHQLEFGYQIARQEFGLKFTYLTTGGKLSQADYSGEISFDVILNGYSPEVYYRIYFLKPSRKFNVYAEAAFGIIFNQMELKEKWILDNGITGGESVDYSATNLSLTPSVGVRYKLTPLLSLRASAGYDIDFYNEKFTDSNYNTGMKSNWSGLRLSAGVSLYFGK